MKTFRPLARFRRRGINEYNMKLTSVNNVIINIEYIEFVESTNNGQSIEVHMIGGKKFLFDINEAQNLMYWLNEIILKGCRGQ